jgi:carboxyl-terminal processing protease
MTLRKSIPFLILISLVLSFGQDISAQKKKTPRKKTTVTGKRWTVTVTSANAARTTTPVRSPEQKRRYDTFMKVWQTIHDNYFDQTFGGLDWMDVWREFDVRVAKLKTDEELHNLLTEMIGRLNKSHFAIVPPEVYKAIETAKTTARLREKMRREAKEITPASGEVDEAADEIEEEALDLYAKYGIGVELRLLNDQFTITHIIEGSAAEKAKLKTGYIIERINDVSLGEFMKSIEVRYSYMRNVRKLLASEIVTWLLNGDEGTDVGLTYLNEKDERKEVRIDREKLTGTGVSIGKNFPEQYLDFEVRSIGDDVGYFKFNLFAMPIVERFCNALTDFKNKKAIIIDLRGNHGGLFAALMGIGGMMSDRDVDLGTQIYRAGTEKFKASSQAKNFKGKLVVLVDEGSVSSAEVLAAALQEGGRALIVGEKTAGQALPALSVQLDTGAVLIYPIANLKTAKGNLLEGVGVTPDLTVELDRKSLLEGRDLQLEAALKAVRENRQLPAPQSIVIKGDATAPLPPPPARAPFKLSNGPGTALSASPPSMVPPPPAPAPVKDEKSLALIAEFLSLIGGEEAIRKVESYSVKGTGVMRMRGSEVDAEIEIYRQTTDKYSELVKTNTLGELRQIYIRDNFLLQTDFGLITEMPAGPSTARQELLYPILRLVDKSAFKSLEYAGIYDRQDRKVHLINAKSADGADIAMAFDVETKLLVGYAGSFMTYTLGDYQKTQDLLLPFSIDRGSAAITIYQLKVNVPIDESNFKRKINCFDTPN